MHFYGRRDRNLHIQFIIKYKWKSTPIHFEKLTNSFIAFNFNFLFLFFISKINKQEIENRVHLTDIFFLNFLKGKSFFKWMIGFKWINFISSTPEKEEIVYRPVKFFFLVHTPFFKDIAINNEPVLESYKVKKKM